MFCSSCGTEAADQAAYCSKCGNSLGAVVAVPPPPMPAVTENIDGVLYHPGTGKYAGLHSGPRGWVKITDGVPVKMSPGQVKQFTATAADASGAVTVGGQRSAGRTIAAVLSLIVAGLAALQGFSWFSGMMDLQNEGNQFAGMLAPLALGAFAVAAGFGIAGIVLLNKK